MDDAGRYGRVELDQAGRIQGFIEKDPAFHGSSPVSAGVYLFSAALLDEIAAGNATSLERDVFARAPSGSLAAFTWSTSLSSISGTPESLALAGEVIGSRASEEGYGNDHQPHSIPDFPVRRRYRLSDVV